ncbi:MAG: efflux RND transporter periplasmic adaptor subunit [Oceanicaulis sp.]
MSEETARLRQDSGERTEDRSESGDRGWIGWLQIAGIVLVILVAAGITIWLSSTGGEPGEAAPERPDVPVRVTDPVIADHRVSVALTGTVSVTAFVDLTPQVGGRVMSVSDAVRAGSAFEAGEVLFEIDPRDYEVAVTRARSALAQARSSLAQAQAEAEVAREEWDNLYPGRPITPLAAREPQLEAARGQLLSAQADLDQARLNLERTSVSLPFAGKVIESRVEAGALVSAGQSYGRAYDLEAVELIAPISPTDLARLGAAEGAPVRLSLEAGGPGFPGRVARIGAQLDERTRFIDLYIEPEAGDLVLQPGLFADVMIQGPLLEDVMILPPGAVAGLNEVRLIEDGAIVTERIEVLDRPPGRIIARAFDVHEGLVVSPLPEGAIGREAEIIEQVEPPQADAGLSDISGPYQGGYASPAERAAETGEAADDMDVAPEPERREGARG